MNRRALLAALGAGATVVAGCLADDTDPGPSGDETDATDSNDSSDADSEDGTDADDSSLNTDGTETENVDDSPEYEPCDRPIVWYWELPDDVAAEVDAALEDGAYETDGDLLYAQAVAADTALSIDDAYYAADIERDGKTTILRLAETTPTKRSPEELVFRNETDEAIEVAVTVTREGGDGGTEGDGDEDRDGTVVLEEEGIVVDSREDHEDEHRLPVTDEYGDYEITVELANGRRETLDWRIQYTALNAVVTVSSDEIAVGSEMVMDIGLCPWNES